jgi:choline dehydrogenase-like flavoprotein
MILGHRDYDTEHSLEADVVIVGTGAGGAPLGAVLAEAGFDVLYLEEGGFHPTSSFNAFASQSIARLMRDGGTTTIQGRPLIPYIEGRCVGGSTVINGGMSWRTPEPILREWERLTASEQLGPESLEPYFAQVQRDTAMGPQLPLSLGDDNRIMAAGAERMGWQHMKNTRGQYLCVGCNNCVTGCPTGAKSSTLVSYIPRAQKAGARIATELRVESLIIDGGACVGCEGRAINPRTRKRDKRVRVRAKATVIACGAVQTPHLLLRHGLGKPSGQLGRNFLCHPNAKVLALYPDEVKAWQGVSQWGQVRAFRDDGVLFAENMISPSALAALQPVHAQPLWEIMSRYNSMVLGGVLVEDSTTGRIRRGPLDMAIPQYQVTPYDIKRFVSGVSHMARMHLEMGADKVLLPFARRHWASSIDDLDDLEAQVETPDELDLFTVHLMGTARMGSRPGHSVVDLDGRLWDLPGCYVSDASLFPTAIGVNPQLTIMAMAIRIGERLAASLAAHR